MDRSSILRASTKCQSRFSCFSAGKAAFLFKRPFWFEQLLPEQPLARHARPPPSLSGAQAPRPYVSMPIGLSACQALRLDAGGPIGLPGPTSRCRRAYRLAGPYVSAPICLIDPLKWEERYKQRVLRYDEPSFTYERIRDDAGSKREAELNRGPSDTMRVR